MDVTKQNLINKTIVSDNLPLDNVTIWTLDTICMIFMITALSITGTMGNAPTLIVFMKRKDKHASNTFIKILAVIDLLVCMFVMPFTIFYELHVVTSGVACRLFEFLSHFSVFASNATLAAIATERYIAVCKIGLKLTIKMVNRGAVAIFVVSVFVAMPAIGVFAVVDKDAVLNITCTFPHEQAPQKFCHFTYTIMGVEAVTIYQILQMGMFLIILLVIIILYTSVYMVLWKRTKIRKQLTASRTRFLSNVGQTEVDESEYSSSEIKPVIDRTEEIATCGINVNKCHTKRNSLPNLRYVTFENIIRRRTNSEPCDLPSSSERCYTEQQSRTIEQDVSKTTKKARRSQRRVELQSQAVVTKSRRYYYHIRTAKMLFLCTVVYFITWVPFWLDIFGVTSSRAFRYMFFIGHATNPIVYGIVNKQVRAAGRRLFYSCLLTVCGVRNDIALRTDGFTTGYFSNESERIGINADPVKLYENSLKK